MENLFEWINNMLDTHPVVTASIAIAIAHYNMVMDGVGGVLGS